MADILKAYTVAIFSLLAGAAFVHNIYKPDLVRLPWCRTVDERHAVSQEHAALAVPLQLLSFINLIARCTANAQQPQIA
jgi:hypothetical protein